MNNKKNALLLSGGLFVAVWLILFLVAVTERGGVAVNFGIASVVSACIGLVCFVSWLALDTVDKRKNASGVFSFQYYRLKRKAKKELEQARDTHFSNLAYLYDVEEIEYNFTRDAKILGVDHDTIRADFADILGAVK